MTISIDNFTADGVRGFLDRQAEAKRAEEAIAAARAKADREALHAAFEARDLPPDALANVLLMVQRTLERDPRAREVMVFHFPSEFMSDSGRSVTSHSADWPQHLTGVAARAYAFFDRELAPRGFTLGAQVIDFPGGMPGDVGIFLRW